MGAESDVVGYTFNKTTISLTALHCASRSHLRASSPAPLTRQHWPSDSQAFFSSRDSSFQSFFCSSSRALKVDSCSAGVRLFHEASICSQSERRKRAAGGWRDRLDGV